MVENQHCPPSILDRAGGVVALEPIHLIICIDPYGLRSISHRAQDIIILRASPVTKLDPQVSYATCNALKPCAVPKNVTHIVRIGLWSSRNSPLAGLQHPNALYQGVRQVAGENLNVWRKLHRLTGIHLRQQSSHRLIHPVVDHVAISLAESCDYSQVQLLQGQASRDNLAGELCLVIQLGARLKGWQNPNTEGHHRRQKSGQSRRPRSRGFGLEGRHSEKEHNDSGTYRRACGTQNDSAFPNAHYPLPLWIGRHFATAHHRAETDHA